MLNLASMMVQLVDTQLSLLVGLVVSIEAVDMCRFADTQWPLLVALVAGKTVDNCQFDTLWGTVMPLLLLLQKGIVLA